MSDPKTARDNVQITETNEDLIIRVRKNLDFGLSSTGKTRIVASTGGFTQRESGLRINLNVVRDP